MAWLKRLIELILQLIRGTPPSPPPPLPPPPLPPLPTPAERVDRVWDPGATRGVTAFALTLRDRAYIRDFVDHVHAHGYTTLRVGAQTSGWAGFDAPYLHAGPGPDTPEWHQNLETLLDETARHRNTWVQLIPGFTHKQSGGTRYQMRLARKVLDLVLAMGVKHVVWEVVNEFKHPLTHPGFKDEDVLEIGRMLKGESGFMVGTDHHGKTQNGEWKAYYPQDWRSFDYYAFHPPRNPDPTTEEYERAINRYGGRWILFDETNCYASQKEVKAYGLKGKGTVVMMGRGTETERKDMVREQKRKIKLASARAADGVGARRGKYFFHAIWLMECKGLGWLPQY